jgi:hypothetical protein
MVNRTWRFSSVAHRERDATSHVWKWEAMIGERVIGKSRHRFSTLLECVRDAHRCGFAGDVDPATGSFVADKYHITTHDDGAVTLSPLC